MNEHQNDGGGAPSVGGKKRESVGVSEELVAESPVNGGGGGDGQCEDVESGDQINKFELSRLPHRVHYFPVAPKICFSVFFFF